jgi:hypothetical protein
MDGPGSRLTRLEESVISGLPSLAPLAKDSTVVISGQHSPVTSMTLPLSFWASAGCKQRNHDHGRTMFASTVEWDHCVRRAHPMHSIDCRSDAIPANHISLP